MHHTTDRYAFRGSLSSLYMNSRIGTPSFNVLEYRRWREEKLGIHAQGHAGRRVARPLCKTAWRLCQILRSRSHSEEGEGHQQF
jgi:hypothetical protein